MPPGKVGDYSTVSELPDDPTDYSINPNSKIHLFGSGPGQQIYPEDAFKKRTFLSDRTTDYDKKRQYFTHIDSFMDYVYNLPPSDFVATKGTFKPQGMLKMPRDKDGSGIVASGAFYDPVNRAVYDDNGELLIYADNHNAIYPGKLTLHQYIMSSVNQAELAALEGI